MESLTTDSRVSLSLKSIFPGSYFLGDQNLQTIFTTKCLRMVLPCVKEVLINAAAFSIHAVWVFLGNIATTGLGPDPLTPRMTGGGGRR